MMTVSCSTTSLFDGALVTVESRQAGWALVPLALSFSKSASRPPLSPGGQSAAGEGGDRLTAGRPLQHTGLLSLALLFFSSSCRGWSHLLEATGQQPHQLH
ncbi:hypothetical protein ILYODFUR_008037 [Ilyodon furcidens]|uniref:Uncharacterized protein n=1 Tax=Ilyodon furcidens TaxID=33524 RepID=A0ABV0V463_9TELE